MSEPVSYDASLVHDESYLATSHKGLTYPFGTHAPGSGEITRIADGICWARIPMPGSLGHINSWLLDDADGWAVVDTGMRTEDTVAAWRQLLAKGINAGFNEGNLKWRALPRDPQVMAQSVTPIDTAARMSAVCARPSRK